MSLQKIKSSGLLPEPKIRIQSGFCQSESKGQKGQEMRGESYERGLLLSPDPFVPFVSRRRAEMSHPFTINHKLEGESQGERSHPGVLTINQLMEEAIEWYVESINN